MRGAWRRSRHPRPGLRRPADIKAAIALPDWLTARDLTLATARQGDLEEWLASTQARYRADAVNLVLRARKQKLTRARAANRELMARLNTS